MRWTQKQDSEAGTSLNTHEFRLLLIIIYFEVTTLTSQRSVHDFENNIQRPGELYLNSFELKPTLNSQLWEQHSEAGTTLLSRPLNIQTTLISQLWKQHATELGNCLGGEGGEQSLGFLLLLLFLLFLLA